MQSKVRNGTVLVVSSLVAGAAVFACSSGPAAPTVGVTTVHASLAAHGQQQLSGHLTPAIKSAPIVGRMPASTPLTLTMGLVVKDRAGLLDFAAAVSDPTSSSYRRYLTNDQFADRFGVSAAEYDAVLDWARSKGFTPESRPSRLQVVLHGTVADVEAAMGVHMSYGLRPDATQFFAPDAEPSVDFDVPVELIDGLQNFRLPRSNTGSAPGGAYWGNDFRSAYAAGTALTGGGQTVGIFMSDGFYQSDINQYAAAIGQTFLPVQMYPRGPAPNPGGSQEGTLDIDMVLSMAPGAQVVAFIGGSSLQILSAMASRTDIRQFSSSWTWYNGATAHVDVMAQLAAQGQSFFQSTGDSGAYAVNSFANAASGTWDCRQFPDITLVGGTALDMANNGASYGSLEQAWSSGGGGIEVYSLVYQPDGGVVLGGIPWYQGGIAGANGASKTNRNVPDVSAMANDGYIYFTPQTGPAGWQNLSGTSEATPLWAGFTALVNQLASQNGVGAVGFAAPKLYALAASPTAYESDFHDVISGSNGYNAGPGYDLATGLGTPTVALISTLAGGPGCAPTSTCSSEYVSSKILNETVETISVVCQSQPAEVQVLQSNGTWALLQAFSANASDPPPENPRVFGIGVQSGGTATSGAAVGSTQTIRACTAGGACDAPVTVTIADCCVPLACPGSCGKMSDGCGGTLECGGCPAGLVCSNYNQCEKCAVSRLCGTGQYFSETTCACERDFCACGGTYPACKVCQ